jgi:hypothetical protein
LAVKFVHVAPFRGHGLSFFGSHETLRCAGFFVTVAQALAVLSRSCGAVRKRSTYPRKPLRSASKRSQSME